ncbi:MAG TPA: Calx-beta domain-containing protein, partial [Gemmatimonadales bacterium]|nr:Calx-beta domain-containing protein [Gemmatimonadales bacterium]
AAQVVTVSFTAAAQSVGEGVGTATITAQLSSASSQTVTVPFTVSGTAANPADYTITASPLTITAGNTSASITVTVVADAVAEGDETVIVTMGTPTNATLGATTVHTLTITASGGGGGTVTVSFANCPVADRAVWLAYQDGNGAWTRVIGAGDVYTFGVTSGTGGIAWVVLGAGNESSVQVQYMTQAELTAGTLDFCAGAIPTGRTITGTVANLQITEQAYLSLGGGVGTAMFFQPAFTMTGVQDGTHDLVGFKSDFATPGAERGLLRRDIVVTADGSVGTVDFTGGESFAAASATMTLMGLTGGETIFQSVSYLVTAQCVPASLGIGGIGAATFTAFGIPVAPQRGSDYHQISIIASTGTIVRTVTESFHTFGARTVTLGSSLAAPTVTPLAGPYKRLQAVFTVPGEYGGPSFFGYVDASTDKRVNLNASAAYRGGPGITLALADFSALAGWDNNWAPASAATGDWNVGATGGSTGSACVENATQKSAAHGGTF